MKLLALILGKQFGSSDLSFKYAGPARFREAFEQHYQQYIARHVRRFEADRRIALDSYRARARTALSVTLLYALVLVPAVWQHFGTGFLDWVAIIGVVIASVLANWARGPVKRYSSDIKLLIFPEVVRFFGEDFSFSEYANWSVYALKSSLIIPSFDEERSEDLVTGSYNGVDLKLMETQLIRESRDSRGRKSTTTVFRGMLIQLSMNKAVQAQVVVRGDKGRIGNFLSRAPRGFERVVLEDPVFERSFEVFSTDQVESRYLLTPSFMERLLALQAIFGRARLECSVIGERVLFTISSRHNRFEPGPIYEPASFSSGINGLLRELDEIFQMIDVLKLQERTGL